MSILKIVLRKQSTANFNFYKVSFNLLNPSHSQINFVIKVECKDFRRKILGIPIGSSSADLWRSFVEGRTKPPFHKHMLAFFSSDTPSKTSTYGFALIILCTSYFLILLQCRIFCTKQRE